MYTINNININNSNNELNLFMELAPPFSQPVGEHSSMIVWQDIPVYPGGHWQVNEFIPLVQNPPFWQGFDEHSSMLVWQDDPVKPGEHSHIEQAAFGDPPFWHINPHAEMTYYIHRCIANIF